MELVHDAAKEEQMHHLALGALALPLLNPLGFLHDSSRTIGHAVIVPASHLDEYALEEVSLVPLIV